MVLCVLVRQCQEILKKCSFITDILKINVRKIYNFFIKLQ